MSFWHSQHTERIEGGSMSCISLLTDFGLKDGNVGVMKGVIWGMAPSAQIVDLSHDISPQDIREAAFVLARSAPYFPEATIHLVVVDPGVGTDRRAIAARIGPYKFVGPDNGVITRFLERAESRGWQAYFIHLDQSKYWLSEVSNVFHGRDIFAPIAAHLANGVPMNTMGTRIDDPVRLKLPKPQRMGNQLQGEVIYIDHFGSLVTNISRSELRSTQVLIHLGDSEVRGLAHTFGDRPPGSLIALFSSTDDLLISVVNGSAAERLVAQIGDPVEVLLPEVVTSDRY